MAMPRRRYVLAGLLAAVGLPTAAVLREVVETIELLSGDIMGA